MVKVVFLLLIGDAAAAMVADRSDRIMLSFMLIGVYTRAEHV